MKKYLLLSIIFLIPLLNSCSDTKDISERKALMMPRLSEQPRNAKKYKDVSYNKKANNKKKTYKSKSRR